MLNMPAKHKGIARYRQNRWVAFMVSSACGPSELSLQAQAHLIVLPCYPVSFRRCKTRPGRLWPSKGFHLESGAGSVGNSIDPDADATLTGADKAVAQGSKALGTGLFQLG